MPDAKAASITRKDVFHVINRGEGKDAIWKQVGVGFINKDGSLNLVLDEMPATEDGVYKLHVRDHKPKETRA